MIIMTKIINKQIIQTIIIEKLGNLWLLIFITSFLYIF